MTRLGMISYRWNVLSQVLPLAASLCFLLAGVGFGWMFLQFYRNRHPDWKTIRWFLILPGTSLALGLYGIVYVLFDLVRKFEFFADDETLTCVSHWGILGRDRCWKREEIAGTILRDTDYQSLGGPLKSLELLRPDGYSVPILPLRTIAVLAPVNTAIRQWIASTLPRGDAQLQAIGSGVVAIEMPNGVRIVAKPISPFAVPGMLYGMATAFAFGQPAFSLYMLIAIYEQLIRAPLFPLPWFIFFGQFFTCLIGGLAVRKRISSIAACQYEIVINSSTVTIVEMQEGMAKTEQLKLQDIQDVRSAAVVSRGGTKWERKSSLVQLELIPRDSRPISFLYGRPARETDWVLERVRSALQLPTQGLNGEAVQ